jgi:hypothetical protein
MPFFNGGTLGELILSVFIASIPGIVVAFLAQYLEQRREDRNTLRIYVSARRLLALEVDNNRAALHTLWRAINDLDTEQHSDLKEHLAAMAAGGLLGVPLPHWSFARWQRLEAITYAAFSEAEVTGVDQINRGLETISELYTQLVTLTHEEKAQMESGSTARFWPSYYAGWRDLTFTKLTQVVNQTLDAPHPISPK